MNEKSTETLSVVVEREIPHPPEKIWRALTQPHLIEEWLMKTDFKPVVDHRFNLGLGRCRLSGRDSRAEQNAVLHVECCARRHGRSEERGDLDSHANEHGDPPAHGAVGLPAGSAAGLPGCQVRVAAVFCDPGAGIGTDGLMRVSFNNAVAALLSWSHEPEPEFEA